MIIRSLIAARAFVWSEDPALDKDSPAYDPEEFKRTGDLKYMPALDGGKVTVFEIKPLPMDVFVRVLSLSGLEQCKEAVAYGVRGIRDFEADGQPVEAKTTKVDGVERLTKDTMNRIFEPMLFAELGLRILELSRLHPQSGSR